MMTSRENQEFVFQYPKIFEFEKRISAVIATKYQYFPLWVQVLTLVLGMG